MDSSHAYLYQPYLQQIEANLGLAWPIKPNKEWLKQMTTLQGFALEDSLSTTTQSVWDLLERGGKRWRPLVMLLCCEACGGTVAQAARLSSLVELPHNASLIVDDIEDNSPLRRGKPAVHLLYGLDTTINSANFAYFAPTALIDDHYSPTMQAQLYRIWAEGMRSVHLGQGLDITWHNQQYYLPSMEEYLTMIRLKTGGLASMAAQLGATLAQAAPSLCVQLGQQIATMGMGFQILDDVINLTSGAKGKKRGDDLIEGKKSLPIITYCLNHPNQQQAMLARLATIKDGDLTPLNQVLDTLIQSGATEASRQVALSYLDESKKNLYQLLPSNPAQQLLNQLIDHFMETML